MPKLTFHVGGLAAGGSYSLRWQIVGPFARGRCTSIGEGISSGSDSTGIVFGPLPYGDYGSSSYRPFCVGRSYHATIQRFGGGVQGTFTFRGAHVGERPTTVRVSPSGLVFGAAPVGGASAPQDVTLTNTGAAALRVADVAIEGSDRSGFEVVANGCAGHSLDPGLSCSITVRATPHFEGSSTATLSFTDNAPDSPQRVAVTGSGSGGPVGGAAVTGTVRRGDASGPSVAGTEIIFCPPGAVGFGSCSTTQSDDAGRYGFVHLGPGRYTIQAWDLSLADTQVVATLDVPANVAVGHDIVVRRSDPLPPGVSVDGADGHFVAGQVPVINWNDPSRYRLPIGPVPPGQPNSRRLFGAIFELTAPTGLNAADVALFEVRYDATGQPAAVSQLVEGPGQVLPGPVATSSAATRARPRVGEVMPCVPSRDLFEFRPSAAGGAEFRLNVPGGAPVVVRFDPIALPSPQPTGSAGVDVIANGLVAVANGALDAIPGVGEYNEAIYGLNVAAHVANRDYAGALESGVFNFGLPALGEHNGIPGDPFHGVASFSAWEFSSGVAESTADSALEPDPSSSDPCGLAHLGADLFVDPSGRVLTRRGTPVLHARVTLSQSATHSGALRPVPNGSAVMSPANRRNPDFTDALGHFGWDVLPGRYRVTATHPGCRASRRSAAARTRVFLVPPPVANLVLRLDCPRLRLAHSRIAVRSSHASVHGTGPVITLLARVTARGRTRPLGTVGFAVGRRRLGTLPLDRRGEATLVVAGVRGRRFTATYSGDGRHSPSTAHTTA